MHAAVSGADKSQQEEEEEEEEQSVIKGLLPCILGVGGVAFAIWIGIYVWVAAQGIKLISLYTEHFLLSSIFQVCDKQSCDTSTSSTMVEWISNGSIQSPCIWQMVLPG